MQLMTPDKAQAAADFGQHIPGGPRASAHGGTLQTMPEHHPTISGATHSRGKLSGHKSPAEVSLVFEAGPCTVEQ